MIAIRGAGSQIAVALASLLDGDAIERVARHGPMPLHADRYLFCDGLLIPKRRSELSIEEAEDTFEANYAGVASACDYVLKNNPRARICVMGSESGFAGSFNEAYAAAKRDLHAYVETTPVGPEQQLVCVAPSIIADAGMTTRRRDVDVLERRRAGHPKKRFLTAIEVARLVHFVLYVDRGYLSNVVIRMNGGEHACR